MARREALYWALAAIGAIVPLSAFLPWIGTHGFDPGRFGADLFANRVSAFFGLDVILSALVVFVFASIEGRRFDRRALWLPVIATCLIGVSCGLPMLLALRERADRA